MLGAHLLAGAESIQILMLGHSQTDDPNSV